MGYWRGGRPGPWGVVGGGFGPALGWGRGRGFRRRMGAGGPIPPRPRGWYGAAPWKPYSEEDEINWLKGQADMLKADLEAIQQRMDELSKEQS
jgi:hypothetical protein